MTTTVVINELSIEAEELELTIVEKKGKHIHQLAIDFHVTHDHYHEVTVELYKNDFLVKIPDKQVVFRGTIQTYLTSITNLYEKGAVGKFTLVLLETAND
ncbi:DUF3219 family protein [Ornithinibacillus contaminans]|uniref:DUF3219 family protein n=1 Tax=Ornithinibacillus contaminans TaxID=694055 RepID=UPI00064DB18B|nr:DUF3219 family protein [Ornithinibacillus contaminans]